MEIKKKHISFLRGCKILKNFRNRITEVKEFAAVGQTSFLGSGTIIKSISACLGLRISEVSN